MTNHSTALKVKFLTDKAVTHIWNLNVRVCSLKFEFPVNTLKTN